MSSTGPASLLPAQTIGLTATERDVSRWPATVGFAGVLAVLLCAPYEATRPLVQLPGQSMSSVETLLALVVLAWAVASGLARRRPLVGTPLSVPTACLLAALALSAVAAPAHRANAWHMVGRFGLAAALALLVVNSVPTERHARRVLAAATASGVLVAILVLVDYTGWPPLQSWLGAFRTQTATVGAQTRASGPFQYPTIASMFLEVTFAAGVGCLPLAISRRTAAAVSLFGGLLLIAGAIVLTYTRAGIVTMLLALVIVAAWHAVRQGPDRATIAMAALAVAIVAMLVLSRSAEAVRLRLSTEQQGGWYRARIEAPAQLTLAAGSRQPVPVTVTNTGRVTWDSSAARPFGFSYHWLLGDRVVSWEGIRSVFPRPVAPGERVALTALLEAPREPGDYRVVLDLYQEHLLWFSTEPDATLTETRATLTGTRAGPALDVSALPAMPAPATRPGRRLLWTAAARMIAERPWLGVGPDNFRLLYGPYAQLSRPDARVHTNNMYLELVVGGGLLAAAALLWMAARVVSLTRALWRRATSRDAVGVASATVAVVAAIAVHGLVDAFLGFTPTYAVIGVFMGLLAASGGWWVTDARRV